TGKYHRSQPAPDGSRVASGKFPDSLQRLIDDEATFEAVDRLRPVAEQAGLSLVELALAWVLRRPEVASAITGATRPEHVHANAKACGIRLAPDTLAAIDEVLGDVPVKQPTLAPYTREGVT